MQQFSYLNFTYCDYSSKYLHLFLYVNMFVQFPSWKFSPAVYLIIPCRNAHIISKYTDKRFISIYRNWTRTMFLSILMVYFSTPSIRKTAQHQWEMNDDQYEAQVEGYWQVKTKVPWQKQPQCQFALHKSLRDYASVYICTYNLYIGINVCMSCIP
jgi:hypothetical protein